MATHDFKNLETWKMSMNLVIDVYEVTKKLPNEEKYALSDQLKRAAVSIPSNIAEGQKRSNVKETVQFSYIALGSCAEVETQLLLVKNLYDIDVKEALSKTSSVGRMLAALTKSLKGPK